MGGTGGGEMLDAGRRSPESVICTQDAKVQFKAMRPS